MIYKILGFILILLSGSSVGSELPNPFILDSGQTITQFSQWDQRRSEMRQQLLGIEYGNQPPLPETFGLENEASNDICFWFDQALGIYKSSLISTEFTAGQCGSNNGFVAEKNTAFMRFGPNNELKMKVGYWRPKHLVGPQPTILAMEPVWWDDPFVINDIIPRLMERGVVFAGFYIDKHVNDCPQGYPDDEYLNDPDYPWAGNIEPCGLASYEDPDYYPVKYAYPGYDWGVISIGAWAYRVAMSYFETLAVVNTDQVAIWGHSRRAKSCLLAGALDDRFKMVVSHMSGLGGSASYRVVNSGAETLAHFSSVFPHWLKSGFENSDVNTLPFDQHYLHALIAPRPLYIHVGQYDYWGNPAGEAASYYGGREVYRYYDAESRIGIYYGPYDHIDPGETWDSWETLLQWMELHFKGQQPGKNFKAPIYGENYRNFSWANPLTVTNNFVWNFWDWPNSTQTWDKPLGLGDVNGDGSDDVGIINGFGFVSAANIVDGYIESPQYLGNPKRDWNWWGFSSYDTWDRPLGLGDVDGDGVDDLITLAGNGYIYATLIKNGKLSNWITLGSPHVTWGWALTSQQNWDKPVGVGDVNGDGVDDIVIINGAGQILALIIENNTISRYIYMGNPHAQYGWALNSQQTWDKPIGVGDINDDGYDDIIITNGDGSFIGLIVSNGVISHAVYMGNPGNTWGWTFSSQGSWDKPVGVGDLNNDGFDDVLFINGDGTLLGIEIINGVMNRAYIPGNPHLSWGWAFKS